MSKRLLSGIMLIAVGLVFTAETRVVAQFDIFDFVPGSEGPWSDEDETTLVVNKVLDGSIQLDADVSSEEYGGFEGVTVTPGDNAFILSWPPDRSWDDEDDSSFTFYLAHDDEFLYVGVQVLDDEVNSDNLPREFWKDDSIEIIVDALNARDDVNTDQSSDPYGGHCYVNFLGKISVWDEDSETISGTTWSTALEWIYGDDEEDDIYGFGDETDEGWSLEVRFRKSLFEDPDQDNFLEDGYTMGFNIGMDDDDLRGPEGTEGSGERSRDLELQYWWANRAVVTQGDNGRLMHSGTGEIIFDEEIAVPAEGFIRGDCNGDGDTNISDPVFALGGLFGGGGGSPCLEACEVNGDGNFNISDPVSHLNNLFSGGPPPVAPGPDCGADPEPDTSLGCEAPGC